jgi:hypothetical protein
VISGQEYSGDSEDLRLFQDIINVLARQRTQLGSANINADELLRAATLAVEEDLNGPNSPLRAEIPAAVSEIKAHCFGLAS